MGLCHDFNLFLDNHEEIRGLIDLTYVVADIGRQNMPNFQLNNYPPPFSPVNASTQFMGSNYVWVFNGVGGMGRAQKLVGWIQALVTG
ncbi:10678_t:CDS:1, partial [Funneliformis geosporum]